MRSFHQQDMKRWAILLSLGGFCFAQTSFAQIIDPPTAVPELDPIVTLEKSPTPIPIPAMLEQPLGEQTTQEQSMTEPPLPSSVGEPIIPTLSVVSPISSAENNPAVPVKPLISTPLISTKLGIGHCHYASQLNLTSNQRFRLKHSKATFVQDNKAAFDSLRIKRDLLKRLGKNPESAREREQRDQLQAEIRQELQALKAKREAQINHILRPEQSDQLQALKAECQPQAQDSPMKSHFYNPNPAERQLNRTIRQIPKKTL